MSSASMKALVLQKPGIEGLELVDRPAPEPGEAEVLVKVGACGVGGTVLRKVQGLQPSKLPRIPGHEITGVVNALGPGVTDVRVGDRVLVYTYVSCGRCQNCWRDRASLCKRTPNRDAWERGEHWDAGFRIGEDADGGFAEYVVVPVRNALPLPDGVSFLDATTAVDAIATSLRVLRRANVVPGENVLVVGAAGGLGVHLLQVARWFGANPIGVDLPDKLERLGRYGAVETIDGTDLAWHERLDSPADIAVDFVGSPSTLSASLASLADRGRLVTMTPDVGVDLPVPTRLMVAGEYEIIGSKSHSQADVQNGAQLLASGAVEPVISQSVPLTAVPDLLRDLDANTLFARGAVSFD